MDPIFISLLISAMGFALNIYTVNKGNIKNAEQTGRVLQSVDNLKDDVKDIKSSIESSRQQIGAIDNRLTALETRVTGIEEKVR
jgi:hypothetical protein